MKLGIISLLLVLVSTMAMAEKVIGTFTVSTSCPAYVSKNKKTNPDNIYLHPGETFELREINRASKPDWFRVVIHDNLNSLRWISVSCGTPEYSTTSSGSCEQNPGLADSYVLALSWQPGFCQTYGYEAGKPECLHLSKSSYQASHLVLHGLWPNQEQCGEHYGFCRAAPKNNHCEYPPLSLDQEVASKLKILMPSYAFGSCLERHEWNKHGSCQLLSSNEYFSLAMRLAKEADETDLGAFLHKHRGETVSRVELENQIAQSFGISNAHKIYLGCKAGILVDIYIELPPLIPAEDPLSDLIQRAPDFKRYQGCPAHIGISDFNNEESL